MANLTDKKKILVINPSRLIPTTMAFQERVITMTKVLNMEHQVDLITLYKTERERESTKSELSNVTNDLYLFRKPNVGFLRRKLLTGVLRTVSFLTLYPFSLFYPNWPSIRNKIQKVISRNDYDIVQVESWLQAGIFKDLTDDTYKVLDTHDVHYEKRTLEKKHHKEKLSQMDKLELKRYKELELRNTGLANLIISISHKDEDVFKGHFSDKHHLTIPIGKHLEQFTKYPRDDDGLTILFYGSMGGKQNIIAFWRLYRNIFPQIKRVIPEVRLIALGANPPEKIRELDAKEEITVTGFIDDVREIIGQASLMVLPLETSGGFRGRIVEVMAMGVPVIGTHNALDCTEITHGLHGYISDKDKEIANYAIELLRGSEKRKEMGNNSKKFVKNNYSLKSTYEKLSRYYAKL